MVVTRNHLLGLFVVGLVLGVIFLRCKDGVTGIGIPKTFLPENG